MAKMSNLAKLLSSFGKGRNSSLSREKRINRLGQSIDDKYNDEDIFSDSDWEKRNELLRLKKENNEVIQEEFHKIKEALVYAGVPDKIAAESAYSILQKLSESENPEINEIIQ